MSTATLAFGRARVLRDFTSVAVVVGEALSGVLAGTSWNGLTLSRMDPLQGWLSPRLHLDGSSSAYWGSLVECQVINGRLSVGARDVVGGYRFQLFE